MSLLKTIKEAEELKKSQYAELPVDLANSKTFSYSNLNNEDLNILINEKLSPDDINKLIDNNNAEILDHLLNRKDLTLDNYLRILNNEKEIHGLSEDEKDDLYSFVADGLSKFGQDNSYILQQLNAHGLMRLSNTLFLSKDALDLAVSRRDLSTDQLIKLVNNHRFDQKNAIELISHPDQRIVTYAAIKTILRHPDQSQELISAILNSGNNSLIEDLKNNKTIAPFLREMQPVDSRLMKALKNINELMKYLKEDK